MATIPKLKIKIINLLNKLIFTTQHTSKPISRVITDIKFNNFPNQNKNSKHFTYCILVD